MLDGAQHSQRFPTGHNDLPLPTRRGHRLPPTSTGHRWTGRFDQPSSHLLGGPGAHTIRCGAGHDGHHVVTGQCPAADGQLGQSVL